MSDYIPPDLIPNILTRLPVSDVLRCTSVCKSWYDLITSSSFISLHLKLSTPNQESRLLVNSFDVASYGYKLHCKVHLDNQTFDEIAELNFPFTWSSMMIGSINGLFCLFNSSRVFLWNPSIRKSLMLPDFGLKTFHGAKFGFCFIPETNDYKIVKLLLPRDNTELMQVDIYKLSTNSWRNRNVRYPQVSYISLNSDPAVFLNGTLHWGVTSHYNDNDGGGDFGTFGKLIVSFDMRNENIGALSIPSCLEDPSLYFDLSTFEESLCLIHSTITHYNGNEELRCTRFLDNAV